MAISFNYQVSNFSLRQKNKIKDWILLSAYLERKEVREISYVFCDDEYLWNLNKKFLHHKTYTDIITFDYSSKKEITGEIYISVDRVRENAAIYQIPFYEELRRVMIHGILHCFGYSDKTKRGQTQMRKKEDDFIQLFFQMK